MSEFEVIFTEKEKAELIKTGKMPEPGDTQVAGETLYSLISTGTELALYRALAQGDWAKFPCRPGYAAVFKVAKTGKNVKKIKKGDVVFYMGKHCGFMVKEEKDCIKLPSGLGPKTAVLTRIMGISMTTLSTTTARPPSKVIITGLGIVGHMAAKIFMASGYEVYAVDPSVEKRETAKKAGITNVLSAIPVDDPEFTKKIALVVECSGHEKAVLDACKVVKMKGEVVCLGVPWKKNTDISAHELLYPLFHNYVVLRSGWEWELDLYPNDLQKNSIFDNFAGAMRWLNEGTVKVDGIYEIVSPKDCQKVYQALMNNKFEKLVAIFDWKQI